jgi:hypothetical protein
VLCGCTAITGLLFPEPDLAGVSSLRHHLEANVSLAYNAYNFANVLDKDASDVPLLHEVV